MTPPNVPLRVVPLGRKNFLFAGLKSGAERAAALSFLLGSAKFNELDPELHLRHVLTDIADHPVHRIHDLLPWNVSLTNALDQSQITVHINYGDT